MADITLTTADITHPSVAAVEITCSARDFVDCDTFNAALEEAGVPVKLRPNGVTPVTALKRSMQSFCRGDRERDVKVKGRKQGAVYTILLTNTDRLDREEDDGQGVSDAELSARIEYGEDSYSIKVTPEEHPAAPLIRSRQDDFCGKYSATYDLKVWLTQRLLPYLGAVRSPDAQGKYLLPKTDNEDSVKLLLAVQKATRNLTGGGKLRIYTRGVSAGDADTVDIIADAMEDERNRVLSALEEELERNDKGTKRIGKRRLASMTQEAHTLREKLQRLAESFGMASDDAETGIEEVEKRLGLAELALGD